MIDATRDICLIQSVHDGLIITEPPIKSRRRGADNLQHMSMRVIIHIYAECANNSYIYKPIRNIVFSFRRSSVS